MADLSSALARPRFTPAVSVERWQELLHSESPAISEAAADGLARVALALGDFSIADPLLDHPTDAARRAAFLAADALAATGALPRLTARLLVDAPANPWPELAVLERLAATTTRAQLSPENVELPELEELSDAWLDRSGGQLSEHLLLHLVAGDALAPVKAVEAIRRRDAAAVVGELQPLVPASLASVKPWDRAMAEALLTRLRRLLDALSHDPPRKERFDRVATTALLDAVRLQSRVRRDPRSALALAFLEGTDASTVCERPADDVLPLLDALANAPSAGAADVVMSVALGWRIPEAVPFVVRIASRASFYWSFARASRAAQLDRAFVEALRRSEAVPGTIGLLANLVSSDAEQLAWPVLEAGDPSHAIATPFLLRAFPTPGCVSHAAKAPALGRDDLQDRLEFLADLDPTLIVPMRNHPVAHCLACGAVWSAESLPIARTASDFVPDPAVPCPSCGVVGDAVVHGSDDARASPANPLIQPYESPRQALAREREGHRSLLLVDLADLAGDSGFAEDTLQLIDRLEYRASPALALRLLRRRQRFSEAKKLALEVLASPMSMLFDEEKTLVESELALACEALAEPVPPIPSRERPPDLQPTSTAHAMQKVGRNDPCPCGSGRKFKKCHGA